MSSPPPLRVVLVDDNEMYRETLKLVFGMRDEIDVIASVSTGDEAAHVCSALAPDVVLMDYRMPGLNGAEATRAVLDACPTTRVVCLSASVTQQEIDEVRAAGAVGCVTKDEDFDSLLATVRDAAA
jgi:DNA-binding NarL/FixJ family response regulator